MTQGEALTTARLSLSVAKEACDSPEWRLKSLFGRGEQEIAQGLRALGLYQARVRSEWQPGSPCWKARFEVEPGPPVTVAGVEVVLTGEAAIDPSFVGVKEQSPLKEGAPLLHSQYEALKTRLTSLAAERGYLDAHFVESQLLVDPDQGKAWARLNLDSGVRYRIGAVRVDQEVLKDKVIARMVTLKPGDPYDSNVLLETYRNLSESGHFSRVDVRAAVNERKEGQVPVDVDLTAVKRHSYDFTLGASTDHGPYAGVEYENRRINTLGHRVTGKLQLSPVLSEAAAEYKVPLLQEPWKDAGIGLRFKREVTDSTDSMLAALRATATRTRGDWNETWSFDVQRELSHEAVDLWTTLVMPGVTWDRLVSDDPLDPKEGYKVLVEARGASEAVLSTVDFFQVRAKGKWVTTLGEKGRFIGRAELGATAVDDAALLPQSVRFYAGGDQSVRGYGYNALGPKDATGEVIGGAFLAAASVEFEQRIGDAYGAAVFIDGGNAFDDFSDEFKLGAGVGVRWYSPVGPLRLDVAVPSDRSEDNFRIHFSMGPAL